MSQLFDEDGVQLICQCGSERLCDECLQEMTGDATRAYVGSGEDAPIAYQIGSSTRKEIIAL